MRFTILSDNSTTTTMESSEISSLSDSQEKVLSILPFFPAMLSCLGSAQIVYMVATSKKKTPYRRILLGLSCSDIFASLVYPWQSFLVPKATSQRVWAIGNDASCSLLGFCSQLFFISIFYNAMLSIYFVLSVRQGIKDPVLAQRYEPWMHVISIGFPLLTASIGAGMGWYHEVEIGHGCWITDYPEGCGCNEGDTGECCKSQTIAWMVGGLPTLLCFFVILLNNLLVYCHVRATIQRGRQRATPEVRMSQKQSSRQRQPQSDPQLARVRAVATQAFLYVAAFLVAYLPSIILRAMEGASYDAEDEDQLFPLLVIQAITFPSQGLFNLLVYVRPSYLRVRKEFPQASRFWSFRRAMFGDRIQPTTGHRAHHSTQFGVASQFFRRGRLRMISSNTKGDVGRRTRLSTGLQASALEDRDDPKAAVEAQVDEGEEGPLVKTMGTDSEEDRPDDASQQNSIDMQEDGAPVTVVGEAAEAEQPERVEREATTIATQGMDENGGEEEGSGVLT